MPRLESASWSERRSLAVFRGADPSDVSACQNVRAPANFDCRNPLSRGLEPSADEVPSEGAEAAKQEQTLWLGNHDDPADSLNCRSGGDSGGNGTGASVHELINLVIRCGCKNDRVQSLSL